MLVDAVATRIARTIRHDFDEDVRGNTTDLGAAGRTRPTREMDRLCHGKCVLFDGEASPVCYCAGLIGGCVAPHHCCGMGACTWPEACP